VVRDEGMEGGRAVATGWTRYHNKGEGIGDKGDIENTCQSESESRSRSLRAQESQEHEKS
jgi:hypothetical protein